jgi:hypothetical protein
MNPLCILVAEPSSAPVSNLSKCFIIDRYFCGFSASPLLMTHEAIGSAYETLLTKENKQSFLTARTS